MRYSFVLFALLNLFRDDLFTQVTIEEARMMDLGTSVTVKGIVTNGEELGIIRYMQDETAGIAVYPGNGSIEGFSEEVKAGDSLLVTGELSQFNDLLEISPITDYKVISSGNELPQPVLLSVDEVGKANESTLISLNCLSFLQTGDFAVGTIELIDSDGNGIGLFLGNDNPILGTPIPETPVDLVAISSVFREPQILVRNVEDLVPTTCVAFTRWPELEYFDRNQIQISWETNEVGSSGMRYGTDSNLNAEVVMVNATPGHIIILSDLSPGTIYFTQALTFIRSDTLVGPVQVYATESESSGQMRVLFNTPLDTTISNGIRPESTIGRGIVDALIDLIAGAEISIEVSSFNNNNEDIVDALAAAALRGVRVRFIANDGSFNAALDRELPFPVIYGNTSALMHNKFFVFDADDVMNSWVWTGSTNMSNQQLFDDPNDVILIQDQSLARTYQLEFDEMWGTDKLQPDFTNTRFGAAKTDNTPHEFRIGGNRVQCYFSPSDDPTHQIVDALRTTDFEVAFGLLSFTRNEIGATLVDLHRAGKTVRGIINNIGDSGSEYLYLQENGVSVGSHPDERLFHHKYAIIDGFYPDSDPQVITGSHNWTSAAEERNDENFLIIHNEDIANLLFTAVYLSL